jgi:hypothetical protein
MNPYKPSALGNQLQGQFFKRGVINCKWKFLGEIDLTGCTVRQKQSSYYQWKVIIYKSLLSLLRIFLPDSGPPSAALM